MTLKELRDKITATKVELRALADQRKRERRISVASVTTLETRLDAEEGRTQSCREVGRTATASPGSANDRDVDGTSSLAGRRPIATATPIPKPRERGQLVLTREFIGDMLSIAVSASGMRSIIGRVPRSLLDEETTRAMRAHQRVWTPRIVPRRRPSGRTRRPPDLGTTSDALGGFLIPPDTAAYSAACSGG